MKNTIKFILISLFIVAHLGCSNKSSEENVTNDLNEESELKKSLIVMAGELESNDSLRIKNITTENGYSSLISWSDSLNDNSFINRLSKDLKYYNVADINKWNDSMIALSLGKLDKIVGATHGYIVLKRINNELRIDEFRGGK
jgi:hypothetical protein